LIKFLITLIVVTGVILAVGFWGLETLPTYFYRTLIFLFVSTAGLYRFLLKTKQERSDYFVQLYLLTLAIKLMAYGVYMFIVIRSQPDQAVPNAVFFMAVYFIFTAIEISFLYRQVNR
jgi:hypothetical protein